MANNNTKENMVKVRVTDDWNGEVKCLLLNPSQVRVFEWLESNQLLGDEVKIEILDKEEIYNTI